MNRALDIEQRRQQIQLISNLIDARITLAGYVVQIGPQSWAIPGTIPVDGNVLVAEFASSGKTPQRDPRRGRPLPVGQSPRNPRTA